MKAYGDFICNEELLLTNSSALSQYQCIKNELHIPEMYRLGYLGTKLLDIGETFLSGWVTQSELIWKF